MTTIQGTGHAELGPRAVFSRVLVGSDGSHEGGEAARQAAGSRTAS